MIPAQSEDTVYKYCMLAFSPRSAAGNSPPLDSKARHPGPNGPSRAGALTVMEWDRVSVTIFIARQHAMNAERDILLLILPMQTGDSASSVGTVSKRMDIVFNSIV